MPISRAPLPILLLLLSVSLSAACSAPAPEQGSRERGGPGVSDDESRPPRGRAWVIFGSDTVQAEVAATPQQRERGLMGRTELPAGTGMLFVFEDAQVRRFWMRNTPIPLDIGFLDQRQVLFDVQAMDPLDEELTESTGPAMFALEVPQGWFESRGIQPGTQARVVFGLR